MRIARALLIALFVPSLALAQTITPGSGSLNALGHSWTFSQIQDAFTGNNLLMDNKATSCHGTALAWDGTTLTLTWHHPYPFDPNTGQAWPNNQPPVFTASRTDVPPDIYNIFPTTC